MASCKDCWYYSDLSTSLCCNEKSAYNLQRVQPDSFCFKWQGKEGERYLPFEDEDTVVNDCHICEEYFEKKGILPENIHAWCKDCPFDGGCDDGK